MLCPPQKRIADIFLLAECFLKKGTQLFCGCKKGELWAFERYFFAVCGRSGSRRAVPPEGRRKAKAVFKKAAAFLKTALAGRLKIGRAARTRPAAHSAKASLKKPAARPLKKSTSTGNLYFKNSAVKQPADRFYKSRHPKKSAAFFLRLLQALEKRSRPSLS